MFHTLQSALKSGQEARILKIYFNATFHMVNHQGILNKLRSVGIGHNTYWIFVTARASVLWVSNRSQHVTVDGCRSKLVNFVSGVQQDSVLGGLLFLLYISELFPFWKKNPRTATSARLVSSLTFEGSN